MSPLCSLPDEIEHVRSATIVTGRYQAWRPEHGVPVRTTVGRPRFWRGPQLVDGRVLAPYGLLGKGLSDAECRERYWARLDDRADLVVQGLADIVRQHPGQTLVLCCFEDVTKGQECHRRWFATWAERRLGIVVPEVAVEGAQRLV
jgi:hypothetical protein